MDRENLLELLYARDSARRYTQDSAVLPDVWIEYLEDPGGKVDLLLIPFQPPTGRAVTPGELAADLRTRLSAAEATDAEDDQGDTGDNEVDKGDGQVTSIAYHQASVAVKLTFTQLIRTVLPMSRWWFRRVVRDESRTIAKKLSDENVCEELASRLAGPSTNQTRAAWDNKKKPTLPSDVLCLVQVIGTLARWESASSDIKKEKSKKKQQQIRDEVWPPPPLEKKSEKETEKQSKEKSKRSKYFRGIVDAVAELLADADAYEGDNHVYTVSKNRPAKATLWQSRETVKCDAATRLFQLDCSNLTWAVLDTGIEARLPAFREREPDGSLKAIQDNKDWSRSSRVAATYDFTKFRDVLLTGDLSDWLPEQIAALDKQDPDRKQLKQHLKHGQFLDWSFWEPIIRVSHDATYSSPQHPHGTHVAGILAADWRKDDKDYETKEAKENGEENGEENGRHGPAPEWDLQGICPTIRLYDLRVLGEDGEGNEFSVMAALQFIQYVNSHKGLMVVHGVNLSLGMHHDTANYACGATPVCDECTRAVGSGLVLVAAAGNDGYIDATGLLPKRGYQSISISDPGNAESVITVGSTHREMPHTYGVSYFSSRGPTGDGRRKPDLLAPGEKIESCVPDGEVQRMDGTSMAAPHVSGAAALLMARNRELIRQPQRIKQLLCDSATDLHRIQDFQGFGLVDCLRALQSV